ncbi:MAG TPA: PA14 domain-containing protein, partial [Gemmatimonadaceae bacterium]|nr:PA14 domain-containing protein [Gemmatimonadaceae bacterium]
YDRFDPIRSWQVSFFTRPDSVAPGAVVATQTTPRLDYMWYRPTVPNVPQANFRIEASSTVSLPPGKYLLRTISDDAVRVWIDDKLAIDNWKPHESEINVAPISPGAHRLRVEYYQLTGWVELRAEILRKPDL